MKTRLAFSLITGMIIFQLLFYYLSAEIIIPIIGLISLLVILYISQKIDIAVPKVFTILYGLYFSANVFSFISNFSFYSLIETVKTASLYIFSLAVFNLNISDKKFSENIIFPVLSGTAAFMSLIGILEYSGRNQLLQSIGLFEPFHWPSLTAGFLTLVLPITLMLYITKQTSRLFSIYTFTSLALIITAWILTREYLHFILLLVICTFAFYIHWQKRLIFRQSILFLLLLIFTLLPNLISSFGTYQIDSQTALHQMNYFLFNKEDAVGAGINIGKEHFITGVGPGNFGKYYQLSLQQPWTFSQQTGIELLQTFSELGIAGLLFQFLLFVYIFQLAIRIITVSWKKRNWNQYMTAISAISFLAISIFSFAFRLLPASLLLFFFMGLMLENVASYRLTKKAVLGLSLAPLAILLLLFLNSMLFNIGQRQYAGGNTSRSMAILSFLNNEPTIFINPRIYFWLSAIAIDKKDYQKGIENLLSAKKLDKLDLEIDYQIAHLYYQNGNIQKAGQILETLAKGINYLPPKFYWSIAQVYYEEKNLPLSLYWLKRASVFYPVNNKLNSVNLIILEHNNYLSYIQHIYYTLYNYTQNPIYKDQLNNLL